MKIKAALILVIGILISVASPCVYAAASPAESETGYIVCLEDSADTVRLMSAASLEAVSAEHNIYKAETLEEIKALGSAAEYYEPDVPAYLLDLPKDSYVKNQWPLKSLGMERVWSKGYDGRGIRVAVIDSGINSLHEDFEGISLDRGKNMLDGSYDVTDENGHGTFVSGLIAAAAGNGKGIAGLCHGVTLVPLKSFGNGNSTGASNIVAAIYEAVDVLDCDVINLSNGTSADMLTMKTAVEYAKDHGVIVVSAVGNNLSGQNELNYPAAYSSVVGVGSVDKNNTVPGFSTKNQSVFVVAPGVDVLSLGNKSTNEYKRGDGTSYSAPHVTAAAIILKQYAPSADTEDFMELLKLSSYDGGATGFDTSYGYGILDIDKFVSGMEEYSFAAIGEKYPDVAGHWALDSIDFCVSNKLFNGVAEKRFAPEETMTRAMFVTVLSRMSGESISGFPINFSDVSAGEWFAQSACWGKSTGIVSGVAENTFAPGNPVTREQIALFLYRYANTYKLYVINASGASLSDFSDGSSISDWSQTAMQWAVANSLITGRDGNLLCPQSTAKRSEVATIVQRFIAAFGSPQ